jgi:uncharacterized protein YggU (UPF0235/DUF167 family)
VVVGDDGQVRVYVTVAPQGGEANRAIIALLAKTLGVARGAVAIQRGHTGRDKLVAIDGLSHAQALARLTTTA